MRKITLMFAAAAVAMSFAAGSLHAQSLDEVLTGYYEAVGGVDGWKALNSMKATGKMVMPGMGMELPFVIMTKRPNKSRIEFTLQGMTGIQAYDGETAWMVMPFMGSSDPEEMTADMAQEVRDQADIDGPLIGWEEDGHQLELIGQEDIEGTPAYKIQVTMDTGDVTYYYLDAEYFIPIKISASREMQGQTIEAETLLSDYKDVGGLLMPHSMEVRSGAMPGGGQTITIDVIEMGVDLDDSIFAMPAKEGGSD